MKIADLPVEELMLPGNRSCPAAAPRWRIVMH